MAYDVVIGQTATRMCEDHNTSVMRLSHEAHLYLGFICEGRHVLPKDDQDVNTRAPRTIVINISLE